MGKKRGLYDNINAKRARIKAGSGEKMRSPGDKGAPSAQDFKDAAKTAKKKDGGLYKMQDGGLFVQSKGCGAVDNKRRKPTKIT
tara:strand:+ start:345 stop:596 length:252 start_codon:yes stop_codon:yes gene_type:complete